MWTTNADVSVAISEFESTVRERNSACEGVCVRVSFLLTNVFDDVSNGGLEELIHGFLSEPQHPLGGPLDDVHTGTHTHTQARTERGEFRVRYSASQILSQRDMLTYTHSQAH